MDQSYDEGKQLESVSVALGHKIGKEVIGLLIAVGGRGLKREPPRFQTGKTYNKD